MPMQKRRLRPAGFTLIEVVAALAIFALAAVALTKISMQYSQATARSILQSKAQFVAQNEVALMQIQQQWLSGQESKQVTSQGETWQIDKKASKTISPNVQRIDMRVSLYDRSDAKVLSGLANMIFFNLQSGASEDATHAHEPSDVSEDTTHAHDEITDTDDSLSLQP